MSKTKSFRILCVIAALAIVCLALTAFVACSDNGGGSSDAEITVTFYVDGAKYDAITTNGKDAIRLPAAPTKEGYEFAGWYLDDGTFEQSFTGAVTANVSVYAKWAEEGTNPSDPTVSFTVTFVVDGAPYETIAWAQGTTFTLPAAPTKEGYDFAGWYLDNGTFAQSFTGEITADVTVYAKWTEKGSAAHEHTFGAWTLTTPPTCTEKGVETRACSGCTVVETRDVDPLDHNWGEWTITTPASCTEKGEETRVCKNDAKHVETRAIDAKGHTEVTDKAVEPTCTTTGLTEGKHCSVCKEVLVKRQVIDALDHDWGEWAITTPATCTEKGEETRVCKRDEKHIETRAIDAKGHTEVTDKAVEPTCTTTGLTEGKHCSVCEEVLVKQQVIDALDHDWGEWTITTPATCTEKGEETRVCKRDEKHIETRAIDAKGHAYGNLVPEVGASLTNTGLQAHYQCDACKKYFNEDKVEVTYDSLVISKIPTNVTFDMNGGKGTQDDIKLTFAEALPALESPAPTREGYDFAGYFYGEVLIYDASLKPFAGNAWSFAVAEATLTAHWDAIEVSVDFYDGLTSEFLFSKSKIAFDGAMPAIAPEKLPTKSGYVLTGFFSETTGGVKYYNADGTSARLSDLTAFTRLYAQWSDSVYFVHFDANGGKGTMADQQIELDQSEKLTANAYTRTGYTYQGWNTEADGSGDDFADETAVLNAAEKGQTLRLYAVWEAKTYLVTFDDQGGKGGAESTNFTFDALHDDFLALPSMTGHNFLGYFDAAKGGAQYVNASGACEKAWDKDEEDVVLYAHWEAKSFDLKLYTVGENYLNNHVYTVTYGAALPDTNAIPMRNGYIFEGFYLEADGDEQYYDKDMQKTKAAWLIDGAHDLYAHWTAKTFTISFNANGGEGSQKSAEVTFDKAYDAIDVTLSKTGYKLNGFAMTINDVLVFFYNGDGTPAKEAWDYSYGDITSFVLIAEWQIGTYDVTLDVNGGDELDKNDVVHQITYQESYVFPVPTRTGYTFNGWFESEDQRAAANGELIGYVTKDMTLTASWSAKKIAVSYSANGGTGLALSDTYIYFDAEMPDLDCDAPTRSGYTFIGVFDAATGGKKYYNADLSHADGAAVCKLTPSPATLYAQWTANEYVAEFDANGTAKVYDPIDVTFDAILPDAPEAPSREGYDFLGWFGAAEGGKLYYAADGTKKSVWDIADDATLYAHWEAHEHTVTFDANSGTGSQSAVTATYGSAMPKITVSISKTGYNFVGYFDEHSTKYYEADGSSAKNWDLDDGATLYAHWTAKTFTVTLDPGAGSLGDGVSATRSATYNLDFAYPVPTRTGYTFGGWLYDGEVITYATGASTAVWTYLSLGDTPTLTAKWTAKKSLIYYDIITNAGTGDEEAQYATYDAAMPALSITPSKVGYTFAGYFDESVGGTMYYDTTGASAKAWNKTDETFTLYAQFTPKQREIRFSINGGLGEGQPDLIATYDAPMPALTVDLPTRDNFDFLGYFDASTTGYGTKYYNADGSSARNWDKDGTTRVSLYAQWELSPYTIVYDKNGDGVEGTMEDQVMRLLTAENLRARSYFRTGYEFDSWNTEADGSGTKYTNEATVNSIAPAHTTLTLYAIWTPNVYNVSLVTIPQYTVSFDCGGYCENPPAQVVTPTVGLVRPNLFTTEYNSKRYYLSSWKLNYTRYDFSDPVTENITLIADWREISYIAVDPFGEISITIDYYPPSYYYFVAPVSGTYSFILGKPAVIGQAGSPDTRIHTVHISEGDYYTFFVQATVDNETQTGESYMRVICDTPYPDNGKAATATTESTHNQTFDADTTLSVPTAVGYTFQGWFDGENGTGTKYANADGSSAKKWNKTTGLVLYAYFVPNAYSISFSMNGGTGSQESLEATYDAEMPELTNTLPTKSGYVFTGYFANGTKYYNADGSSAANWNIAADTELTAGWKRTPFYVSYDANGGEGTMEDQEIPLDEYAVIKPNEFTKTGYYFIKWNTEADGSGVSYNKLQAVYNIADAFDTVTLYAIWAANSFSITRYVYVKDEFTVSFDLNGAAGDAPASQTVGTTKGVELPQLSRDGYEHVGWCLDSEGTIQFDATQSYNSDLKLYAKWRAATYSGSDPLMALGDSATLTFEASDDRSTPAAYYAFIAPSNMTIHIYTTNYDPDASAVDTYGWLIPASRDVNEYIRNNDDNGTPHFGITYTVTAGTLYYIGVSPYYNNTTSSVVVHIDAVEGTAWKAKMADTSATYDAPFNFGVPSLDGYAFDGWFTEPNGNGTRLTGSDGVGIGTWSIDQGGFSVYAKWILI